MHCGFDVGCQFHALVDPFMFWIKLGFWGFVCVALLAVLYLVRKTFGLPGLLAAIGAILLAAGFKFGRDSIAKSEGDFDPPIRPKKPRKPVKVDDENRPGTWNPREGRWN